MGIALTRCGTSLPSTQADNQTFNVRHWRGSPSVYLAAVVADCPHCFLTFGPNLYTFTSTFVILNVQLRYILNALNMVRAKNISSFTVRALAITGDYSCSCSGQFETEADVSVILLMKMDVMH